ncbi:MAG: hypothetical protein ACK5OI_09010 [Curvibacter sp.]|jgi:hypothetical protein
MNLADSLNLGCACRTLDARKLRAELETTPALAGLVERLALSHPHLFASTVVFLDPQTREEIRQAVGTLDRVCALPAWQDQALEHADPQTRHDHGPQGVFMGYDFHVSTEGPRLIEINTNAGGAFLNAALARAHRACCTSMPALMDPAGELDRTEAVMMDMFRSEWQVQRGGRPWRNVLIVDDEPQAQYLAPEFALARTLFAAQGLLAVVADPRELQWRDGALWHPALPADQPVDLVYNRLTDFALAQPGHAALRSAWAAGAVVLTPHPRAYTLAADKRRLIDLSDPARLEALGVAPADRTRLERVVPATVAVTAANAEALWARRRGLFFKPATGYGARAAYRGDKLTQRVWRDIVAGNYVAQTLVPPSERLVSVNGQAQRLKLDLRAYAYCGQVQLLAARTWSGQTTNFRTEGGGFSPVVVLPEHLQPDWPNVSNSPAFA